MTKEVVDGIILAVLFAVRPFIPDGRYGPFDFFAPRSLWTAMIVVSAVGFVGYFLRKYVGAHRGRVLAASFGSLVSTTAVTAALAAEVRTSPDRQRDCWYAATLANVIQLPRMLIVLGAIYPTMAQAFAIPVIFGTVGGLVLTYRLRHRGPSVQTDELTSQTRPLNLRSALAFAAYLAAVNFAGSALTNEYGTSAIYVTSFFGAVLDVDSITISVTDLVERSMVSHDVARLSLVLAIAANAIVKIGLSGINGTSAFMKNMALSFLVILGSMAVGLIVMAI